MATFNLRPFSDGHHEVRIDFRNRLVIHHRTSAAGNHLFKDGLCNFSHSWGESDHQTSDVQTCTRQFPSGNSQLPLKLCLIIRIKTQAIFHWNQNNSIVQLMKLWFMKVKRCEQSKKLWTYLSLYLWHHLGH